MTAPPAPQPSRTPSPPLPAPPIAASPLGPRAQALQHVFDRALAHTLQRNSRADFAACFPTPARAVPENLDGFWRSFNARLDEVCRAQFATLLTERAVIPSLNALDDLVADAEKRRERARAEAAANGTEVQVPIAPHTLPPPTLHTAHLLPFLTTQSAHLTAQLSDTRAANEALAAEVREQRAAIAAMVAALESGVADLEGAAAALGGAETSVEAEGLRGLVAEMRDVDGALEEG